MRPITKKQAAILKYLCKYFETSMHMPTYREISEEFGFTAKGAQDHLKAIEKKGYIERKEMLSRSIKIIKDEHGRKPEIIWK